MKSACKFGLMSFSEYDRRYKQHEREQKYRIVRREHLHPCGSGTPYTRVFNVHSSPVPSVGAIFVLLTL